MQLIRATALLLGAALSTACGGRTGGLDLVTASSDAGTGGTTGVGGSVAGAGGSFVGAGGSFVGSGGSFIGSGGSFIGAGGSFVGSGGSIFGRGGSPYCDVPCAPPPVCLPGEPSMLPGACCPSCVIGDASVPPLCPPGTHDCGGTCADDHSTDTCGTSCTPCSFASDGIATCDGNSCGVTCDSGFTECSGTCALLESYVTDCGACGHDCLGGDCNAGVCQPFAMVTGQYNPIYLAVNATNLYWSTGGNLVTSLITGSSVDTLYSGTSIEGIALDATYVYWSTYTDGTIMRMPLRGGTAETLLTTTMRPIGVAVDSTTLYFTTSDGSVMAMPVGGGTPKILIGGPPGGFATAVAVNAQNVFWGTFNQLLEAPLSGNGPQTVLAGKQANVFGVALDGSDVYFTNQYGGALYKISLPSGISVTLVSGYSTYAGGVAVDDVSIYWTASQSDNQGSIMRLAK